MIASPKYSCSFGPRYLSGSTAIKFVIASAKGIITEIGAQANKYARAAIELHAFTGGSTNPVTWSEAALPSIGDLAVLQEAFFLGPVKVGASLIETQGMKVMSGIELSKVFHSGHTFVQHVGIEKLRPSIDVDTLDLKTSFTSSLSAVTAFFRKGVIGGDRVAAATEEHVSIALANAYCTPKDARGAWGATATGGFTAVAVDGGSDEIVSQAVDAAIA